MLPGHNDADVGPANSLHASAHYSEYNERFDLKSKLLGAWKKYKFLRSKLIYVFFESCYLIILITFLDI